MSRLAVAGVVALALLATACSNGADVAAEVDASVATTVEAMRSIDEIVAATVEAVLDAQPEPTVATPVPTATPRPTATPVPTATPRPTATPVPTYTPRPTATPVPTAAPVPTATPRPTATPVPTATPHPIPTLSIDERIEFADNNNPELSSLSKSEILEHAYAYCSIAASQPGADYFLKLNEYDLAAGLALQQGVSINVWVSQYLCREDYAQAREAAG